MRAAYEGRPNEEIDIHRRADHLCAAAGRGWHAPVAEVCRKLGISEQKFSRWKRRFVGMRVAELRCLRQLEEENRKLKQLVADLTLDKHMLQEVLRKKL